MLFLSFFSLFCALYGIARSMSRTDREQYTCHKKDVLCLSLEGKSCLCFLANFFSWRIVYVNMNKISSELPRCKFAYMLILSKKSLYSINMGQYWTPWSVTEHTLLPPLRVLTINWPASVGTSVYLLFDETILVYPGQLWWWASRVVKLLLPNRGGCLVGEKICVLVLYHISLLFDN